MIHAITGRVQALKKQQIILELAPFALDIAVPDETFFKGESLVTVFTYLHWNQENGPTLFGFPTVIDRSVFLLIISCSGVGPRLGLSALADLGAAQCVQAIHKGDERMLSKVSGIGIKKAEQIIVQLKHKVQELIASDVLIATEGNLIDWHTISEALRALNYSRAEITQAIAYIREKNHQEKLSSFDQLLRQALTFLSQQQ
jgi:Holliday junction DNA helicase RuvA